MRRRALFAAPMLLLPLVPCRAATLGPGGPAGLRVGGSDEEARHLARRLATGPVFAAGQDRVERLNRGHLELALLTERELAAAAALMGDRLAVLPGRVLGKRVASRTVLPARWRAAWGAALA